MGRAEPDVRPPVAASPSGKLICTRVITPDLRHVDWKKLPEYTPTRPEVIVAHTLNFRPNFKFSRLRFFWGTPVAVRMCAR